MEREHIENIERKGKKKENCERKIARIMFPLSFYILYPYRKEYKKEQK